MAKGDIRLSPTHGVNPSLGVCFFCNEEDGTIILPGRLPGDAEAPRKAVWSMEPCPKCRDWMAQGVIFISVRDGETDPKNPYRTGGWCVLRDEAVIRMLRDDETRATILRKRVAFVPDTVYDALGLPRGEVAAS